MNFRALLLLSGGVLVVGIGAASWKARDQSGQPNVGDEAKPPPPLTALPDADVRRLQKVRSAIAAGERKGHEFREMVVRAAGQLTDEELIAALELAADPNYAIEELCMDEEFPLERCVMLLNHFIDIQDEEGMDDALQSTGYRFAQIDPEATREWLRRFEPGIGMGQGLSAIFAHLTKTDPAAVVALLCDLDDREAEAMIGYGDGPYLREMSGREFLALTDRFRSERLREFHLRQTVVWRLAANDPEDALDYVRELPIEERSVTHGRHLVKAWAREEGRGDQDFSEIAERMTSDLPEGTQSPGIYHTLAEAWRRRSPDESLRWIETLPSGVDRDAAISGFASDPIAADPPTMYSLALMISDGERRRRLAGNVLYRWVSKDIEAVRAELPSADLSDQQRQLIETRLEQISERSSPPP